jgi:hypothetical integral membrane protein (TIGR02206 family)
MNELFREHSGFIRPQNFPRCSPRARVNIDRRKFTQDLTRIEPNPPAIVLPVRWLAGFYLAKGGRLRHHRPQMAQPFVLFGTAHLTAVSLAFVVPAALVAVVRPDGSRTLERAIRLSLAAILAVNWLLWMVLLHERGWLSAANVLPLNLCDWATVATIVTLLRPSQRSYELAYFWALAGTLQGMVTPDVVNDFPDWQFVLFFIYHSGIIASVLYLTFGTGLRPVPASIPRVIGWSFAYAGVAGLADWALGGNYGFLRAKQPYASVFDFMPAWPWYIPVLFALGFASTLIYYAPWFVFDLARARRSPPKPSIDQAIAPRAVADDVPLEPALVSEAKPLQ